MRHKLLRICLTLAVLLVAVSLVVLAAYTATGGELVSLGYLEKTFMPQAVTTGEGIYQKHEDAIVKAAQNDLDAIRNYYEFRLGDLDGSHIQADSLLGLRFKKGDCLTMGTGAALLLLAGQVQVEFSRGAVVDVTAGQEVASKTALQVQHRYLIAEQTVATVTILSDTAVLAPQGRYAFASGTGTDYNQIADAMKAMGLFGGSDTGFGAGYDLEKVPTRIQGLIMFLRLLGEETAALATTAPCPFSDVPAWCQSYVTYAYEKGYTVGISQQEFGPNLELRATEYITLILRALGYRDNGEGAEFSWDTALAKGLQLGLLTAREHKMLTEEPFLRAQVVYLSYYALDAKLKPTGQTLYATLTSSGSLDKAVGDAARSAVTSIRMR